MTVRLKKRHRNYPDLSAKRHYVVIGIEADDYRILNDQGRPYLYSATLFDTVDTEEPGDWVTYVGSDGERYAYPPVLNESGFFEDFFDGKRAAVAAFWHVVNERLAVRSVAV